MTPLKLMKIAGKIMDVLPKTAGASGRVTLSKTQLELMAKEGGKEGELLQKLLRKATNPSVEIGFKAKSNYTIAGLRIKDGNQVVGQGALSITNPGQSNAVVKMRQSIGPNGSIASSNGFIDGGKPADAKDIALSLTRRNGIATADVASGKAYAAHLRVNEDAVVEGAREIGADKFLEIYTRGSNNLQRELDKMMVDARQLLRGGQNQVPIPPMKTVKPLNTDTFVKLKDADFSSVNKYTPKKGDQIDPETIAKLKETKMLSVDEFGQIHQDEKYMPDPDNTLYTKPYIGE